MKQFIAKILIFSVILSLGCLFIVAPTMAGMMPMNEEPTLQKDQADDSNCACCPAEKKETQPSKICYSAAQKDLVKQLSFDSHILPPNQFNCEVSHVIYKNKPAQQSSLAYGPDLRSSVLRL